MEIVFLQAKKKLIKEISKDATTPYPLVKKFTSHHFNVKKTQKGIEDFYAHLQTAAAAGMCLHKGYSFAYQTCPMRISLAYKMYL